jgi:hypothetical protein
MGFSFPPPLMPPNIRQAAPALSKITLEGIRLRMDEYAREIFDLWFGGTAPSVVVFQNERWTNYMRAEPRVVPQVTERLRKHARALQSAGRLGAPSPSFSFFDLPPFPLEIGSAEGGYFVGYNVLHGTDMNAGGFKVSGKYRIAPVIGLLNAPPRAFTVQYQDLDFEFCDMVDVNKKWKADEWAGEAAQAMAAALGGPPPRDYELHIKWRAERPINITLDADHPWIQYP